ncbi:MAG TPA: EF-P lysine aminoacylase EpmA [Chitinispirillaceae bacterium]|jgi:lysyl-tRNA synthetase class 2|nr:EF-P lysine aminoacylase EpmA [Chitinispirillaceae bacterium]
MVPFPNEKSNKSFTIQSARFRAGIIRKIRDFFQTRGALEVETPILSHAASTDCHIDVFKTRFEPFPGSPLKEDVFLQTSPEFHMKRLLAEGFPDIFQICKVFRNGEVGRIHNPEFTLLEWYRRDYDMYKMIEETAELCTCVLGNYRNQKKTYRDLFIEHTGIDPLKTNCAEISLFCKSKGKTHPVFDTLTDALQFTMSEIIEPLLPKDTLCFVYNFPADQAVLALLDKDDSSVARRFELYINGMEIANGFEELTDPEENLRRLREQNLKRKAMGKPVIPEDNSFIESLKAGLPLCSGTALGVDRLIAIASESESIDATISFRWEIS